MKSPGSVLRLSPFVRRLLLWPAALIALVVIIAWLSGSFHDRLDPGVVTGQPEMIKPEQVTAVTMRPVADWVSTVGTVRAVHQTEIGSRLLAQVIKVHVSAGRYVRDGDLLIELDSSDLQARLSQAEANVNAAEVMLEQAESDFEKLTKLREQGAATQGELEDSRRAFEVAQAELAARREAVNETKTQLDYATVRSPFNGMVVDTYVEPGDLARPGMTLLSLHDRLQLEASVPERLAVKLAVGDEVQVELEAIDLKCDGRISEIVPQADIASRAFTVKVTGPCPPGVYSGMFGRMLIPTGEQNQILVPRSAVGRVGQLEMVKVVAAEDKTVDQGSITRRAVRTGRVRGDDIEILAGLREGEQVITQFGDE